MLYLVIGEKGSGLLRQSAEIAKTLGYNSLIIISTLKGVDENLKMVFETYDLNSFEIYQVSEEYFEMRLNVKDLKALKKLVKRLVSEITLEMRKLNVGLAVIYRTNDLPPVVTGYDRNVIIEEFWRMLTADLRLTENDFIFVCETLGEDEREVVSLFVDVEVRITSKERTPVILREY
jgi:hypothetical protein